MKRAVPVIFLIVLIGVLWYAVGSQEPTAIPEPGLVCEVRPTNPAAPSGSGNPATANPTPQQAAGATEKPRNVETPAPMKGSGTADGAKPSVPPASSEGQSKPAESTPNPGAKPADSAPSGAQPKPAETPPKPTPTGTAPARLHMPDGQVVSHAVHIYLLDRNLTSEAQPRLYLLESNAVTERSKSSGKWWDPWVVAPGQTWSQPVEGGTTAAKSGTLLLFDLKNVDFQGKAMRRVKPIVCYSEGGQPQMSIGERDVNLGNIVYASAWAVGISLIGLVLIVALAKSKGGEVMQLLTAQDGHLSLAQVQITLWTIAVGTIVLGYGLVRLAIPEIPESLVVLMGASLATGGLAFFGDMKNQGNPPAEPAAPANPAMPVSPPVKHAWRFRDLVETFDSGVGEGSLAKAQMLFWTVILIVMFVSKSVLDGAIWNVPWPLVALMGFSQAGYVVPKLAPKN
jgi:hypothetical protein